ncbi:GMC oxidoreductase [Paraburkholderia sp. BL10I2N1]|uniref:GMC family oxidoreductase n=1 Tax=Paraburkholderia sp. BL10I2N1 TaxID=1938796 RepID=UPI00105C8635|nr:GMC oxidoreductase [Paraburkholderia sp. BL10I2N1]
MRCGGIAAIPSLPPTFGRPCLEKDDGQTFTGHAAAIFSPCRPTSRGSVQLTSADIHEPPRIDPNYLSTEHDRQEAVAGARLVRRLAATQALLQVTAEETRPAAAVFDEASMLQFVREQSGSVYHLCGTCAMGSDARESVVNDQLQVHGVANLRVVDASIFPNITSGNTNAPTMMVAEKAAAMILDGIALGPASRRPG